MTPTLTPSDLAYYQAIQDDQTYIETWLKVRDLETGAVVDFTLTDQQRKVMAVRKRILDEGRLPRVIVLKHRRPGLSTLAMSIGFKKIATEHNRVAATIAHDKESTEAIFRIAQLFYRELDERVKPHRLTHSNKRDLNFDKLNSLHRIGTAGSEAFGSGDTLDYFHGSEVSKWPGDMDSQRELLASVGSPPSMARSSSSPRPRGWAVSSTNSGRTPRRTATTGRRSSSRGGRTGATEGSSRLRRSMTCLLPTRTRRRTWSGATD